MPSDGSCLFHALVHGRDGSTSRAKAGTLRRKIADVIRNQPELTVAGSSVREWVRGDSGLAVEEYAARITGGAWGGGVELAVHAHVERVAVRVFSPAGNQGKARLIATFGPGGGEQDRGSVSLLYRGGAHYDVVEAGPPTRVEEVAWRRRW